MGFFVNGEPDKCDDSGDCCPTARLEAMAKRTGDRVRQAAAQDNDKNSSKKA